jgi:hypothetical protein
MNVAEMELNGGRRFAGIIRDIAERKAAEDHNDALSIIIPADRLSQSHLAF